MRFYLVNLGCFRNQVDGEIMTGRLCKEGLLTTDDPGTADVIIVNTCSFIDSAVDESIDTILHLSRNKQEGRLKRLIVTGCLPERYRTEIADALPEVDMFLGTGAYDKIIRAVKETPAPFKYDFPDPSNAPLQQADTSRVPTDSHMAYLRLSEGCDCKCTYCMIPRLRGKQRSRPMADIIAEAHNLTERGFKELVLVAQDSTAYGKDLTTSDNIVTLLDELARFKEKIWVRLMYAHPSHLSPELAEIIASCHNICSYLDLPIQHASSKLLRRMGRRYTQEMLYERIVMLRRSVPEIALRTTLIVGFPGETEEDFEILLNFIADVRFDHLGVFQYADAKELSSHHLSDHVAKEIMQQRFETVMTRQEEIATAINQKYLNKTLSVLIEEQSEGGLYVGRTLFQAPEVDGVTYVHGNDLPLFDFVKVSIKDVLAYDLSGEAV